MPKTDMSNYCCPNKIVITFAEGSAKFCNWLNNNPLIEALPVDIVNDPVVAAKNHLQGKTSRERADSLTRIAAPQFRDQFLLERRELYGW